MSSGGAKDAFVLIPAPGEQPGKAERAPALAGQLGPHSGARPAGQPPAGASRQARDAPAGRPTRPPRPAASGFRQGRKESSCGLVRGASAVTVVGSPGRRIGPVASVSSG